jgi:hypothetical protein
MSEFVGKTPVNVLTGASLPVIQQANYSLTLAPYAYYWLKI